MASLSNELKARLLKARSAGEAAALMQDAGAPEELSEPIWAELTRKREADGMELSLDELEAVSGGRRDWVRDGCAATVEPGSWCDSNDSCIWFDVTYDRPPTRSKCPVCGTNLHVEDTDYATNPSDDVTTYKCRNCGYTKRT